MDIPDEVLSLIKLREGFDSTVYRDTLGFPTAGVGHRLSPEELAQYPVGSEVPESVTEAWEESDVQKAFEAATEQAAQLGVPQLANALTSVCFQLGTSWNVKFPTTWHHLMNHQWPDAIAHIRQSLWFKQTPVRANDFIKALQALP